VTRHTNGGVRKVCGCARRRWANCPHAWHFSFKWQGVHHRFSLDKHVGEHVDSKTEAEEIAGDLRKAIRAGTFGQPVVARAAMTLRQLADAYLERYVAVERASTTADFAGGLRVICGTVLPRPTGGRAPFGEWPVVEIVADTVERYREARRAAGAGPGGTNRSLSRLRAVLNWGVRVGYLDATPFKRATVTVVKLSPEPPRSRRLHDGEEAPLLAVCGPHLRACVEAALETGMRRGELLGLRWRDVEGMDLADDGQTIRWAARAELVLPWARTKTRRARRIPISSRLRAVLELRRFDPAGRPLPRDTYVFGTELGQRVRDIKRAWMTAVLKAHGHKPAYTGTMNLTPACRAALDAIDLHFHDLRREAGSRWLEGGVPLHTIRDWLGHSNISQTSTYLSGTARTQHDAMAAYEARLQRIATDAETGGHKGPPAATGQDETPNKTAVGHEPTIM
jgi:integrase